jgi:DNA-binding NarL/FixJ family response regulator
VICRELGLADGTVRTHIQDVFRILNVHNRTQAVFEVSRLRLRLPVVIAASPEPSGKTQ